MENFFARDPQIDDSTALRNLEKKVHFILASLQFNGLLMDTSVNNVELPNEVVEDAQEVAKNSNTNP